jgi:hypothetical protein
MVMAVSACAMPAISADEMAMASGRREFLMGGQTSMKMGMEANGCGAAAGLGAIVATNCEPRRRTAGNRFVECETAQRIADIRIAA